jgi:hypothetical protein
MPRLANLQYAWRATLVKPDQNIKLDNNISILFIKPPRRFYICILIKIKFYILIVTYIFTILDYE